MRFLCLFFLSLAAPNMYAWADAGGEQASASGDEQAGLVLLEKNKKLSALDQFEGIVIDQTFTRPGKEFYQIFTAHWQDQPLSERYTISVKEQPSARFGSQVYIVFGNRRIFQGQISPNRNQIRMLSEAAVGMAYKAVTEGEMQRLLFKDPDLGQDEI
jgi:curli production assembly/transport component CsgE